MQSISIYKVPNGKLLKISLDYDEKDNSINEINIMGDFFAYPEESIESMENELKNTILEKESLIKKINSIINELTSRISAMHVFRSLAKLRTGQPE